MQEISLQRPKTGEEGAYEMDEHGEIGEGDLGISDEEEIGRYVRLANHVKYNQYQRCQIMWGVKLFG